MIDVEEDLKMNTQAWKMMMVIDVIENYQEIIE